MLDRGRISLGILAGGRASRLGGADKAFAVLQGVPLLARTLTVLGPGFAETLVSYNGPKARLEPWAAVAVSDRRDGFPGPLAGLEALLLTANCDWLLSLPVDLRDIPAGLPESMLRALSAGSGSGVVLTDADGLQPLVALWPVRRSLVAVREALDAHALAVHPLVKSLAFGTVDISPLQLGNLNLPSDFE